MKRTVFLTLAMVTFAATGPAQSIPATVPASPPTVISDPIPHGSRVAIGNNPYLVIDEYGNVEAQDIVLKGGRVDVRSVDFAMGCANGADQTGQLDSLCAILNAIAWIAAHPIPRVGYPSLYFPHGRYKIGSLPGIAAHSTLLHFTEAIGMVGDGASQSILDNVSPSSTTALYDNANNCNGGSGAECPIVLARMSFHQNGHLSLGDGIEGINTLYGFLEDVEISNSGGIALSLGGASERWFVSGATIGNSQQSVREVGDTNENVFQRVNVIDPGVDENSYCYSSPVCVNHQLPVIGTGQTWGSNPRPAVYLDGVKGTWQDSSIKSLQYDSGLRVPRELGWIQHNYFEGYAFGGQPRLNFAIEAGGKMELSRTTTAMTTTSMSVGVDDALFQPMYVNDPADVQKEGAHAGADDFCFYPVDYQYGSTLASTVAGITRGTKECVQVWGFAGDGNSYIRQRGANAVAWPPGSIMEQVPMNGFGAARIVANHLNSIATITYGASTYYDGCDDYAQLTTWTGNPSRACASIFAGYVPDGYAIVTPSPSGDVNLSSTLTLDNNSNFTGGPEADGQGIVKVLADAYIALVGDLPLGSIPNFDAIRDTYANGPNVIKFAHYGATWAQGAISDPGAMVTSYPAWGYFDATIPQSGPGQGPIHVMTGEPCAVNFVTGAQSVTKKTCYPITGAP